MHEARFVRNWASVLHLQMHCFARNEESHVVHDKRVLACIIQECVTTLCAQFGLRNHSAMHELGICLKHVQLWYLVFYHAISKGLCKKNGGCQVQVNGHLPLFGVTCVAKV